MLTMLVKNCALRMGRPKLSSIHTYSSRRAKEAHSLAVYRRKSDSGPTSSSSSDGTRGRTSNVSSNNDSRRRSFSSSSNNNNSSTTIGESSTTPIPKKHSTLDGITVENVSIAYHEIEKNMMKRINESNLRRFRVVLISVTLGITWIGAVFGTKIWKMLSDQTAGLAKQTLENESLKVQTQELAMAVVNTVLNDKEVTAHAASFLREASVVPETQEALLRLTLHVLQHPDSLKELTSLAKKLVNVLANDKETIQQVASILTNALQDPKLKKAVTLLIMEVLADPEVLKMVTELTLKVIADPLVLEATNKLLMSSTSTVLADDQIITKSKDFLADVVGDDTLQKEGGDAIWNSVYHALKPSIIRMVGITMVCTSFIVGKVLLSPF